MTKRYREPLEAVKLAGGRPAAFRWRGRSYRVLQVLGHWREDPGWWWRGDGHAIRIEQADLWRVEAVNGTSTRGVFELVRRGSTPGGVWSWRLDRVWD